MSDSLRTWLCTVLGLTILVVPALGQAGRFMPSKKWMNEVRAPEPFIPFRLGVIELGDMHGDEWPEFSGDLRAALRDSNFFQRDSGPRVKLKIESSSEDYDVSRDTVTTSTFVLTYRFMDGDREVSNISVGAPAFNDEYVIGYDYLRAPMAANIKLLLLEMRKAHGDAKFAERAVGMEQEIRKKFDRKGISVTGWVMRGMVATVDGTVAVGKGVGKVGSAAVDIASSPEAAAALQERAAAQQREADFQARFHAEYAQSQAQQYRASPEARETDTTQRRRDTDVPASSTATVTAPKTSTASGSSAATAARAAAPAAEAAPDGIMLTWQNSAGYWFACGPVQCIQAGEDTEEKAIGYVTNEGHSVAYLEKWGKCKRYSVRGMESWHYSVAKVERLASTCLK